ncbi:MAG: 6-bladed beta-propeller, partial [Tannerella sp.]|nr:6-bladed beta-propeller [Tannerella sp.]
TFRFVKLESTDESLIGKIDKLEVFENRIYVMDMQTSSLFVFDDNGKYLFKINDVGQGPKEYIQLDFFDIDRKNRHLVLTDLMGYWIMRYDMNGKFISRTKIPFWVEGVAPLDSGYSLYANYRDNSDKFKQHYNLYIIDSLTNIRKSYFPYNQAGFNKPRIRFLSGGTYYYYGDSCRFFSRLYNTLYNVNSEGLQTRYKFDFGKYAFDIKKLNKRDNLQEYINKSNYYEISYLTENNNFVHFAFSQNFYFFGFYSKSTGNMLLSGSGYDGTSFGCGIPMAAFDDYNVTEMTIDRLLDWKKQIEKGEVQITTDWMREKKKITDDMTEDDNSVLVFYKLKPF